MAKKKRRKITPKKRLTTHRWVGPFLAAFSLTGNVSESARIAKVERNRVYAYMRESTDFAEAFATAQEEADDILEREARRRAVEGVDEPVIHQGELCGVWVDKDGKTVSQDTPDAKLIPLTVKKYSDTLLIFLLKGQRPGKFRDNVKHEHSGPDGKPIETIQLVTAVKPSDV